MQTLLLALLPGILASLWFFGYGILINICIAVSFAVVAEGAVLSLRRRNIRLHLADKSALVTALLLAIAVPPGSPWWIAALGTLFSIVIAKQLYGGLGQNPFNPAMCGYAMLLLAFPLEMTGWHIPTEIVSGPLSLDSLGIPLAASERESLNPLSWTGLKQALLLSFSSSTTAARELIDGLAMATPLIEFKMAGNSAILAAKETGAALFSRESETGWEIVNLGYLLGGLLLLYRKVISWHIPLSIIGTVCVISILFYAPGSVAIYGTPYLHLFGSATMLGAFFIATDPVSAATTSRGKIFYGIIIGVSIYSIRVWGSYLDSIAFAILFGNFCAPLLDHICQGRIFGHGPRAKRVQIQEARRHE
ncbi:MAG: electron transport complex subunit D [Pseudohongiella sp.]|nr:MAG: electron transport complex subunit D [Pseudohongiella sp.]